MVVYKMSRTTSQTNAATGDIHHDFRLGLIPSVAKLSWLVDRDPVNLVVTGIKNNQVVIFDGRPILAM